VLLLLIGGTLLKVSITGTYARYASAGLLPLLVLTGAVLVAIAGVTLWQDLRRRAVPGAAAKCAAESAGADPGGGASDAATAERAESRRGVGWLLLVPALAVLLLAPPALGAHHAARYGTVLATRTADAFPALPEGEPVRVSLVDYASRAVLDQGRTLTGRRIVLSGFVIAGPDGRPYLARMVIGCCAADARPVKVGLAGDVPASLAPGQWIEVVGTYADQSDRDPRSGGLIPYIQVAEFRPVDAPEQQYER
jgi:uncharacterized repeat protein (TIGR03943 family)